MLNWLITKLRASIARTGTTFSDNEEDLASTLTIAEMWRKRGNAFLKSNQLDDAELCYRHGIEAAPNDFTCYANLGYVLLEQKRWDDAEKMLIRATDLNPADFDSQYLIANLNRDRGDWRVAVGWYRKALSINPNFAQCRRDLCIALAQTGEPQEAQAVMAGGPAFSSDPVNFHFFSGVLNLQTENFPAAVKCFSLANQLDPENVSILINLSTVQIAVGNYFEGVRTSQRALSLEPDNPQAFANLSAAYRMTNQRALAIENYRNSLRINPNNLYIHQNLLFDLSDLPDCTPTEYLTEAKVYGKKAASRAKPYSSWLCENPAHQRRPLRVGFVSADLCHHPVGMFLVNALSALSKTRVSAIAYSNRAAEDFFSERLQKLFVEWNRVFAMTDQELAEKIHADRIDVLVDLSGHTGGTRLPVFAWRPAPVQVSWLGYWTSTGIDAMDYILVDKVGVQKGEEEYYSETPWFLPDTRLCFSPPTTAWPIAVSALPALRNGHVTFGSYQKLNKVSQTTLRLWFQVMSALPTSRLRLHAVPTAHEAIVSDLKQVLTQAHLDLARVDFVGEALYENYLESYAEVDIILDSYPYPAGAKTADALWMGVPTLTLTGNTMLARQGESMLSCVGLEDWVAISEEGYVQIAIEKANDLSSLADLRARLRKQVLASPLFDGERFARNLEDAFEGMTTAAKHRNKWCAIPPSDSNSSPESDENVTSSQADGKIC